MRSVLPCCRARLLTIILLVGLTCLAPRVMSAAPVRPALLDTISVEGRGGLSMLREEESHRAEHEAAIRAERLPEIVRRLRAARRIQAFRVSSYMPVWEPSPPHARLQIHRYPILSEARHPGEEFRDSLIAMLGRESVYRDPSRLGQLACGFSPGYGFRAVAGRDTVESLVCFNCKQWFIEMKEGARV